MSDDAARLCSLRDQLRAFAAEREWERFHTPRNLAAAVCVEAAELLEPFRWQLEDDAALSERAKAAIADELGDVLICLVRLADKLELDLYQVATDKIEKNRAKYPVERARGRAHVRSDDE